ncbi:HMG-box, partial [Caulochytrium protostelioides]
MVEPATVDSLTSPYASAANLDAYGQRIKRPPNSFLLFSQKRRRELLLDDRHATTAHLSKILGREWTDMTPEQKAPYVMMANEQRESFQQRYPNYVLSRRPNRRVR